MHTLAYDSNRGPYSRMQVKFVVQYNRLFTFIIYINFVSKFSGLPLYIWGGGSWHIYVLHQLHSNKKYFEDFCRICFLQYLCLCVAIILPGVKLRELQDFREHGLYSGGRSAM